MSKLILIFTSIIFLFGFTINLSAIEKNYMSIDLSSLPQIARYKEKLILRINLVNISVFPRKKNPATISLFVMKKDIKALIQKQTIPADNNIQTREVVFTINHPFNYKDSILIFRYKNLTVEEEINIKLLDYKSSVKKLKIYENQWYFNNIKTILLFDSFNESSYRKWLIPKTINSFFLIPNKQKILWMTTFKLVDKSLFPLNDIDKVSFLYSNHEKKLSSPIASLFCEVFNDNNNIDANSVIIDLGIEDINNLTPYNDYKENLEGLLLLIESKTKKREDFLIYLVQPIIPQLLIRQSKKYLEILTNIANKHHIKLLSEKKYLNDFSGENNIGFHRGNFFKSKKTMKVIIQGITKEISINKEKKFVLYLIIGLLTFLIIFIIHQIKVHHRLKKLIEISTCQH